MNVPVCVVPVVLIVPLLAQQPLAVVEAAGDAYRVATALGDVDGDGVDDLVVGRNGAFVVRRGRSQSPRAFGPERAIPHQVYPTCENACEPRLVDVDGDGDLDLLTLDGQAAIASQSIAVWLANDGAGRFAAPAPLLDTERRPLTWRGSASAVDLADWDRDGRVDLLVATPHLVVHRGTADGFEAAPKALGVTSRGFAIADWDGDGLLDVLAQGDDGIVVHLRRGDRLAPPRLVAKLAAPALPWRIAACDWDRDGRADLLIGDHEPAAARAPATLSPAEQRQLDAAERVLAVVRAELEELARTPPPRDDEDAMARRLTWRDELDRWAERPRAVREQLVGRATGGARSQQRGVVRLLAR